MTKICWLYLSSFIGIVLMTPTVRQAKLLVIIPEKMCISSASFFPLETSSITITPSLQSKYKFQRFLPVLRV